MTMRVDQLKKTLAMHEQQAYLMSKILASNLSLDHKHLCFYLLREAGDYDVSGGIFTCSYYSTLLKFVERTLSLEIAIEKLLKDLEQRKMLKWDSEEEVIYFFSDDDHWKL